MIPLIVSLIIAAPEPRWSAHAEVRVTTGLPDREGMVLGVAAAGARVRLTPSLSLDLLALAIVPLAEADDEAGAGGGGELGLRVSPWPDSPVRPYLRTAMGLSFYGREHPFLPGGDIYEGVLTWGLGLELDLGPLDLTLDAHYTHLSNGQGLGDHNPAYDGVGGSIGVNVPVGGQPVPPPWFLAVAARHGARPDFTPSLEVDLGGGQIDESTYLPARIRLASRVTDATLAQLEVELATLGGEALLEVGLAFVAHLDGLSLGALGGLRSYAGLDDWFGVLQAEAHLSGEVSIVAFGQLEDSEFSGLYGRAAIGARVYPAATLALDLGVGFDRIGHDGGDRSDPYIGVHWAPLTAGPVTVAFFLERQISTADVLGLRLSFDGAERHPRTSARHLGWQRLR